ncbi:transcriptional regulator with XRE-family HTH domain [Bradyrhizobium sp. GM22.5]
MSKIDTKVIRSMTLKRKKKPVEFRRLRELAGLTVPETSDLIKVALGTVYRYERGESRPTKLAMDTLRQAADRRPSR